jgi:hypothetical protein
VLPAVGMLEGVVGKPVRVESPFGTIETLEGTLGMTRSSRRPPIPECKWPEVLILMGALKPQ